MDKKILKFDLDSKNVKIKNILETKDFIKLEIWAISNVYPNNNNSHFPLPTMEKNVAEGNFYDKPVLGKWNSINEDLEVHNSQIKYDSEYDTVYFDYLIVLKNNRVAMEGNTLDILKEEKLMKLLGYSLPFYVNMSIQLGYYGVIRDVCLTKEELGDKLWKKS